MQDVSPTQATAPQPVAPHPSGTRGRVSKLRALPHLADVRVRSQLWHDLPPNPKDFEVEAAFGGALDVLHGLLNTDFGRFAVNALCDAYITTNPRPVTETDVRDICVAAY